MGAATASVVVAAHHYYPEDTKHVATVLYDTTKEWFESLKGTVFWLLTEKKSIFIV